MALERVLKLLDNVINLDETAILNEILLDKAFQQFLINLNTEGEATSQLFEQGIDALGKSLGDYAATTIEGTSKFKGKRQKGQRFDHITLKDTGAFYKSFKVIVTSSDVQIIANPVKEDSNLFDDFGVNIVGLTDENKQLAINVIKERFIQKVRQKIAA